MSAAPRRAPRAGGGERCRLVRASACARGQTLLPMVLLRSACARVRRRRVRCILLVLAVLELEDRSPRLRRSQALRGPLQLCCVRRQLGQLVGAAAVAVLHAVM